MENVLKIFPLDGKSKVNSVYLGEFNFNFRNGIDLLPRLFKLKKPFAPLFATEYDKKYFEKNLTKLENMYARKYSSKSSVKPEVLYEPKPQSVHKYCSVCHQRFEDYLDHINSMQHANNLENNMAFRSAKETITRIHTGFLKNSMDLRLELSNTKEPMTKNLAMSNKETKKSKDTQNSGSERHRSSGDPKNLNIELPAHSVFQSQRNISLGSSVNLLKSLQQYLSNKPSDELSDDLKQVSVYIKNMEKVSHKDTGCQTDEKEDKQIDNVDYALYKIKNDEINMDSPIKLTKYRQREAEYEIHKQIIEENYDFLSVFNKRVKRLKNTVFKSKHQTQLNFDNLLCE